MRRVLSPSRPIPTLTDAIEGLLDLACKICENRAIPDKHRRTIEEISQHDWIRLSNEFEQVYLGLSDLFERLEEVIKIDRQGLIGEHENLMEKLVSLETEYNSLP